MSKDLVPQDSLTAKQRAFVDAFLANGGNRTKAAIEAGYGEKSAHVTGCRLAKHPKIRAALAEYTTQVLAELAPHAALTLGHLLGSKSGYVRLEAAKTILDRNGVGVQKQPTQQQAMVVNIKLGDTKGTPVIDG